MAVSGRRLGGSVKESDYLYDFPCSPCEKDGRNVEAIKHCVDCNTNMCSTCLAHHNKFDMMRGHKVLDQLQTSLGQTKQLPSQRCSKHGGKIIDVFCPEHDAVGCSTCISVDHSSCKGKTYIPDVASGIKTSKELKQLEIEMETLKTKLASLKKLKGDNLQRLKQDKDDLKKEIQYTRKKMNEQLDKMEKQLLDEAEAKFKEKIDAVHASIAEVDDMLATVQEAIEQVKSDNNDADIFVSCKIAKQEMSNKLYHSHARVEEQLHESSFKLDTGENAKLILEGKTMFVSIKAKYTTQKAEYKKDISIRMSDDENLCRVVSMCALPDGRLAIADYNNKKLKKLDPVSSNVSTLIDLPDNPVGICPIDNKRLAVCLVNQMKIQFVSLSEQVSLENSFFVGDRCRDLVHCGGLLYVCCGGFTEHQEERGHVEVYTCAGELLRCFYEECSGPEYISMINDGYITTLYTTGRYDGVHARGTDGVVKHRYPTFLKTLLPFCLIGANQLCIGEYSTGNVYLQTYNDQRILIGKKELKGGPQCLYYGNESSRLYVVPYNCDVIQVFGLQNA